MMGMVTIIKKTYIRCMIIIVGYINEICGDM